MNVIRNPTRRTCSGCRIPLKPSEIVTCTSCSVGHDFLSAALAYVAANPRREPRRRRWSR
jgi:hypothetical protein